MKLTKLSLLLTNLAVATLIVSCKDDDSKTSISNPQLEFEFKFNPNQERLDAFGQAINTLPNGHAGQNPAFKTMGVHYIELLENEYTPVGKGLFIYESPAISSTNGSIDFSKLIKEGADKVWLSVPISQLKSGTYKYIRTSVAYQNYDVYFNLNNIPGIGNLSQQKGTIASFVGDSTYIADLLVKNLSTVINSKKYQGFWAFETQFEEALAIYNKIIIGQSPKGSTTVVNPLAGFNNPIPVGSCLVTGQFETPLIISNSSKNIKISLSYSIEKSFEWIDTNGNGQWDINYPDQVEQVVDMGLRGLKASATY